MNNNNIMHVFIECQLEMVSGGGKDRDKAGLYIYIIQCTYYFLRTFRKIEKSGVVILCNRTDTEPEFFCSVVGNAQPFHL